MFPRPAAQNPSLFLTITGIVLTHIVCVVIVPAPAIAQQNEFKQIASSLARDINSANRHTVTVADFTDLQGNVTELGRFISEELSTQLVVESKSFSVVERIQLAAILKEHQISISGLVDPATIKKLGQFAGVDAIVTGTLVPFADSVRLTAKVLDVGTAKVIAVSSSDLPRTKAVDDLLSRGISNGGAAPARTGSASSSPGSMQKAPQFQLQQNELQLVLKSCAHRGGHLLCVGSVTNTADKPRQIGIAFGGDSTSVVDNSGNSFASERVSFGQINGYPQIQLMPDLPSNFFLSFASPDQSASTVTVVLAYSGEDVPGQAKAVFRNIPVGQK